MVVRSPCQENYPADAHTPARTSQCWSRQTQHGLGVYIWMHLVNGTGNSPSPGQPTGVVKQEKSSRGSVDTTKTGSGPQRVRMSSGERPIGAATGKQSDTEALCKPSPPPPHRRPPSTPPQGPGAGDLDVIWGPDSPPPPPPLFGGGGGGGTLSVGDRSLEAGRQHRALQGTAQGGGGGGCLVLP